MKNILTILNCDEIIFIYWDIMNYLNKVISIEVYKKLYTGESQLI
jgi:hypothetical protein